MAKKKEKATIVDGRQTAQDLLCDRLMNKLERARVENLELRAEIEKLKEERSNYDTKEPARLLVASVVEFGDYQQKVREARINLTTALDNLYEECKTVVDNNGAPSALISGIREAIDYIDDTLLELQKETRRQGMKLDKDNI